MFSLTFLADTIQIGHHTIINGFSGCKMTIIGVRLPRSIDIMFVRFGGVKFDYALWRSWNEADIFLEFNPAILAHLNCHVDDEVSWDVTDMTLNFERISNV